MALKNYTSKVPANQSIAYIEGKIARYGATHIAKELDSRGRVKVLRFQIDTLFPSTTDAAAQKKRLWFEFPSRVEDCERVMRRDLSQKQLSSKTKLADVAAQAERTAWKISADWLDAQLAMVDLSQVEFIQLMLPYLYDPQAKSTLYELFITGKVRAGNLRIGSDA